MLQNIPKKLFKFQSFNEHTIPSLKNNIIWFSKPENLNDPFDLSIQINIGNKKEGYQELYDYYLSLPGMKSEPQYLSNGKINKKFVKLTKDIYESDVNTKIEGFKRMGITCFSEQKNNCPDNILMWSHYSNNHKGYCLEFDTSYEPFLDTQKFHKVIYDTKYPCISPKIIPQTGEFPIEPLITKSKIWKYESEWRCLIDKGDNSINYDSRALSSIYFGYSMPYNQIKQIYNLLHNKKFHFYKMVRSKTEFKLKPRIYYIDNC